MPTTATPVDLRYTWQFGVEIDGLQAAFARGVTLPKKTGEFYHHDEGGKAIGVPLPTGKMTVGDLVVEKLVPGYDGDSWAWDKLLEAVEGPIESALFMASVLEYDKDGKVVGRWDYEDCWVGDVDPAKRDATQKNEPVVETVTIKVGRPVKK